MFAIIRERLARSPRNRWGDLLPGARPANGGGDHGVIINTDDDADGWQQHRLTQAPLKTLRKIEALGASLDNIV